MIETGLTSDLSAGLLADLANRLPQGIRLERLVAAIRDEFHCGAVALLKLEEGTLRPVAAAGLAREALGRRFDVAQHPRLAAILSTRLPVRFEPGNTLPDPYDGLLDNQLGQPLPVHDCMGISVYVEGQHWGALTLDALEANAFDDDARMALQREVLLVSAAIRMTQLEQENTSLRSGLVEHEGELSRVRGEAEIIGRSAVLRRLLHELDVVADSELPVLLMGETGVGKELFARRIHFKSRRSKAPLVQVNCAALPESLAESELFGHVKGAFSGATMDRPGRFDAADGGTLFLDEVGELPMPIQAKLLRVLQNGEIQRLGSDKTLRVNVRVIAATNRLLHDSVKEGGFRADLYHRLSVYPVQIPPLRERDNDVLEIAGHFLELNRSRLGIRSLRLSPASEQALLVYDWPGNVRELEHVISRAALRAVTRGAKHTDIVTLEPELLDVMASTAIVSSALTPSPSAPSMLAGGELPSMKMALDDCQRQMIRAALERSQENWAEAARMLDLDPSNLHKLAKRLGMKR
ncbi:MAG: nitric oxide reductase transcriptional regulator NorR [Oxalobacter sp.]|nr:MAG: nitric oxide reductase transcriptional regulator NorR [Oxalobacter sp.]